MDTALDHLEINFRSKAFELLARLTEKRTPVVIVNTLRTAAEQADALARGVSWVSHSRHQDGKAIDIVPISTYLLHGANKLMWDTTDPVWEVIASTGEGLGLISGYRWKQKDAGHLEAPPGT